MKKLVEAKIAGNSMPSTYTGAHEKLTTKPSSMLAAAFPAPTKEKNQKLVTKYDVSVSGNNYGK